MPAPKNKQNVGRAIHPGEILGQVLRERGISQKDVSCATKKSTPVINDIIKGRRNLSPEIAFMLEALIPDMKATDWLSLQNQYDLARISEDEVISRQKKYIEEWERLKQVFNTSFLKKKLGLSKDGIEENVSTILNYFGGIDASDLLDRASRTEAYFRKSTSHQVDRSNLMTWMLLARKESDDQSCPPVEFDPNKIDELTQALNSIFYKNAGTIEKTKKVLRKYGIKFFVEEKKDLDKTPIDGYSFWEGDNPTIVVSMRYNRLDNFAFTVMHELGHIINHIRQDKTNDFLDIITFAAEETKENEANDFAAKALTGNAPIKKLFKQWSSSPFYAKSQIISTSEEYKINPSILTGLFQHYCENYAICRDLLSRVN